MYSFDQLTDSVELLEKRPPRFIAILLWFLFSVLLGCLVWAWVGTMDVVSKGTAIIQEDSDVYTVRLPLGGHIENIMITNGAEVKKDDLLLQLKNPNIDIKQQQIEQIVSQKEEQKKMLEQLKQSIKVHQASCLKNVDIKIQEEYTAYTHGYQALQEEKNAEIKINVDSKVSNEQDDILQGLFTQKESLQKEIITAKKQVEQVNIADKQKQRIRDQIQLVEAKKEMVESQIGQRIKKLENDRKKIDETKKEKEQQKQNILTQYQQNAMIAINQRIQSVEQEIFVQKQELVVIQRQKEIMNIHAPQNGIIQLKQNLHQGDLLDMGQEILFISSKDNHKKVKILVSPDEMHRIKKGDQVQYLFQLKNGAKQKGVITYIPKTPTLDVNSKMYMYELEATINIKQMDEVYTGILGKASVVTGKVPIWKFLLTKFNL
ncbi:HlyD family efflux transporter periplasmic adaptor subunit [Bacillus sp. (in: firmicutes)]|uniref:HlyD family efflux transporter periplasmic adaptor subunit n=1 Tax=Bacillus sp. TaxID=1409 RepID=UPI0039E4C5B5